jgi:hypothetical protein
MKMNMNDDPCKVEKKKFTDALTEYRTQKRKSLLKPSLEAIPKDKEITPQIITDEMIEKQNKKTSEANKECENARLELIECLEKNGMPHHHFDFEDCDAYR